MANSVSVRIDAALAAAYGVIAERAGVSFSEQINSVLRRALAEEDKLRPLYIPYGRSPEGLEELRKAVNIPRSSWRHIFVFRTLKKSLSILPCERVDEVTPWTVIVRPLHGHPLAIELDQLIAYAYRESLPGFVCPWLNAGAMMHPWTPRCDYVSPYTEPAE